MSLYGLSSAPPAPGPVVVRSNEAGSRVFVKPVDEQAPGSTLGRIGRPERRLGVALFEVLVDHGRLRQDEVAFLEHRHLA
jgi:hypothetical protein